jgi:uncharacterized protein (DUF4415 family)
MKAEDDFSQGKRGVINHLNNNQTKINITLDKDVINWLRETVNFNFGGDYQNLINNILRNYIS